MKKPGQRGSRYAPRGNAYVPRRSGAVASVLEASASQQTRLPPQGAAVRAVDVVQEIAADAMPVFASVGSSGPLVRRWQARQSIAVPIAMTIAALALMQQFPAYKLQGPGLVAVAAESRDAEIGDLTRIAALPADAVDTLRAPALPPLPREQAPLSLSLIPADVVAVRDVGHLGAVPLVRACAVPENERQSSAIVPVSPDQFGSALAGAAEAQTREFVVYDDEYRVIRYPGGDVATLYGVCTDVIVRAYRALGIDLQRLVHESHVGSGDTNISHRRTEALRRFFKKAGASLAITDFAEDYQAGDVVTYHRPQNSGSNDHIAIVSNVTGPSGKPMIVHNRGFGPQVEDALFVNEMTGHFRFQGLPTISPSVSPANVSATSKAVTARVAHRASNRMRNSTVRKIRRAAAVRAASGSTSAKSAPKL